MAAIRAIRSLCCAASILCAISAQIHSQTVGPNGEGSFVPGPNGAPRLVLNEANSWTQPLVVYRNSELELIIPDIRTTAWAASYADSFKQEGIYLTYLYLYGVKSHRTIRELLYVNTRTKIGVIVRNAFTPPIRADLCKPDPAMPLDRITSIVEQVANNYHGESLDDAIAQDEYSAAREAACINPNSADCTMSDEEFRKEHPRYARRQSPMDTLMAQLAPLTARKPSEPCKATR